MPFSGSTFTLPAGATTAVAGNIIQSATWDNIHSDINTGMTQLMSQMIATNGMRNIINDNGGFEVWQRGAGPSASISVAATTVAYTADRWYLATGATQAHVVSAVTGITNGSDIAGKVLRTAGQTGVTLVRFGFPLETYETQQMVGNKVTLSFSIKAGANWSPASGTINALLYVGTGAEAKRNATPYTSETTAISVSTNITTAVTRVSATSAAVIPVGSQQAELQFNWTPVGTAGADDSFTIDDVQIEINGSSTTWTPTNFDRSPFTIMLVGCNVHYKKTFPYAVAPAQGAGLQGAFAINTYGATKSGGQWQFTDIELRATAQVTTYNPSGATANWQDITAAASLNATIDTTTGSNGMKAIYIQAATAAAAEHQLLIHITASAGI